MNKLLLDCHDEIRNLCIDYDQGGDDLERFFAWATDARAMLEKIDIILSSMEDN